MLGLAPVFGKQAINAGMESLAVVALRTAAATALLFFSILFFKRKYLNIFPLGLIGCFFAGGLNGIGSLFYYSGLARVDASLGQLLYAMYPVFVAVLLYLDGLQHGRGTFISLGLAIPALFLLTQTATAEIDVTGVIMMLIAGFLYALHIPINQRVLYEAPAPTVTMYTLLSMTIVVLPAYLLFNRSLPFIPTESWRPLAGLTVVTFLSRLALFAGVKSIGGMRTSLLGLAELLVTVGTAFLWLGETLSPRQWLGTALLVVALVIAGRDRPDRFVSSAHGWLRWLRPRISATGASTTDDPEPIQE
jgi:drug/metabolite transporter (DMT)-like permease